MPSQCGLTLRRSEPHRFHKVRPYQNALTCKGDLMRYWSYPRKNPHSDDGEISITLRRTGNFGFVATVKKVTKNGEEENCDLKSTKASDGGNGIKFAGNIPNQNIIFRSDRQLYVETGLDGIITKGWYSGFGHWEFTCK